MLGTQRHTRNSQLLDPPFSKSPSFSPPQNQSEDQGSRSTQSTKSHSADDHTSKAGSSLNHDDKEVGKPMSFLNPLSVIRRARRKVRRDAEDKEKEITNNPPPFLPAFVSSSSGDSSFLQMDPSRNALRSVDRRDKMKSKSVAEPIDSSVVPTEFDLDLRHMEGIIDPSRLSSSSHGPPISGFSEPSRSGFSLDGRAPTPSLPSSSPPKLGGPMPSDPFISRTPSVRSSDGAQDHHRMSPRTIVPAAIPPHLVSPSQAQGGIAAWKALPSWFSGDQPEPDVSSSEDEKATSSERKPHGRATISRTLQSQSVESHSYRIRVYRTNNEYHILSCSLSTTVAQLSGVLNAIILGPEERDDHRLYLMERGAGSSHRLSPFRIPQISSTERMLAQAERPADIVRRRLEQAGYDVADGLNTLGEGDLSFLMRFVYKSTALGPVVGPLSSRLEHQGLTVH
jgi:adenylate cyclase